MFGFIYNVLCVEYRATSTISKLMGMETPPRGEWLKNKKVFERKQRRN
jgi:hypothetical protein